MNLEAVFSARAVTKFYDMGEVRVHALRGVDIELYAGEMMVLLGPSGSGKSTLLNILGGLDRASDGTVIYRGFDITQAKDKELTQYRRSHVGFVFQFYNLIPSLTALENVAAVTEIAANPMKPAEALDMVGLGGPDAPLSFPVIGRPAAASGDRAGDCEAAERIAVR